MRRCFAQSVLLPTVSARKALFAVGNNTLRTVRPFPRAGANRDEFIEAKWRPATRAPGAQPFTKGALRQAEVTRGMPQPLS